MKHYLFPEPWAHFCQQGGVEVAHGIEKNIVTSTSPRLVGEGGEDVLWNGIRPVLASIGSGDHPMQWETPLLNTIGDNSTQTLRVGSMSCQVGVTGSPQRSSVKDRENNAREKWIRWQIGRYAELVSMEQKSEEGKFLEAELVHGGTRRSWATVKKLWQQGEEQTAQLSLIVKLAQDRALIKALRTIEQRPRRKLFRKHQLQKISRIQEMDIATLRAYTRAPGRTPAEKAGPRQELLAVVREETVDLIENQLALWSMRRMGAMARGYCEQNDKYKDSKRFQNVKTLEYLTRHILVNPRLATVRNLSHHLNNPTYCLQFDSHYRHIWKAYLMIRRREQVLHDAWRWHSHMWGTTARLILITLLHSIDGWRERHQSTPYFRSEGVRGEWMLEPWGPGPFDTASGECHVIEMRSPGAIDYAKWLNIPIEIFASGADWILVCPSVKRLYVVWAAVAASAGANVQFKKELQNHLRKASVNSSWSWCGWILLAEPDELPDKSQWIEGHDHLTILRVPAGVYGQWQDLQAGLELAIEASNAI